MVVRVRQLVMDEVGTRLDHQPLAVEEPAAVARGFFVQSLRHHRCRHQIGDAGRRFARAQKQDGLVLDVLAGDA